MKSKKIIHLLLVALCGVIISKNVTGQNKMVHAEWNKDHLFPASGKFAIQLSTGIPYMGAAEFAYGFTKGFSAGVFFGLPFSGANAYGIRLRKIIFMKNDLRMYAELPVVFYPETTGKEAWFLVYPNLMMEKHFTSGVRVSLGAGLPGAACLDAIIKGHEEPHIISSGEKQSVFTADGGIMGGAWYTLNTGIAFPVTKRIMFSHRLDFIVDGMEGKNIRKKEWFYKPAIIMITGFTFSL